MLDPGKGTFHILRCHPILRFKILMENTDFPAEEIAKKALLIASSICVFTNDHITVEVLRHE